MITFAAILAALLYFLSAGAWAMLGALAVLVVAHEFGHWVVARAFGIPVETFSVGLGSSPRLVLGKLWGTEFQVTPWLLGGFVSINPTDDTFRTCAAWKRASVLVAGVVMNVIVAVLLLFMLFATVGEQKRELVGISVSDFPAKAQASPARDAGMAVGDRIVSIGGKPVHSFAELRAALSASKGVPVEVAVERAGTSMTFTVTPNGEGLIGFIPAGQVETTYRPMNLGEAASRSVTLPAVAAYEMGKGLLIMMGALPTPEGLPEGASDVRGVVAIVQVGAAAYENGLYNFVILVVMISLNLAVLNILPIPLLDGGHLMFLGIETLMGRPLDPRIQNALSFAGLVLILSLFFLGLFNDVFRPLKLK